MTADFTASPVMSLRMNQHCREDLGSLSVTSEQIPDAKVKVTRIAQKFLLCSVKSQIEVSPPTCLAKKFSST